MSNPFFIDTHAHLDDKRFDEDRREVIERALKAGLKRIISIGCWSIEDGFSAVEGLLHEHDFIYGALGVHPHDAAKVEAEAVFSRIRELCLDTEGEARASKIVAIGETGLDYHYDNSPRPAQQALFREHIQLAREL
ncbi:MAG: TatD family hydrolase, partial [Thermodesulfobacteriota bacterium]